MKSITELMQCAVLYNRNYGDAFEAFSQACSVQPQVYKSTVNLKIEDGQVFDFDKILTKLDLPGNFSRIISRTMRTNGRDGFTGLIGEVMIFKAGIHSEYPDTPMNSMPFKLAPPIVDHRFTAVDVVRLAKDLVTVSVVSNSEEEAKSLNKLL